MARFGGYYQGWDRCKGCGQTLVRVGDSLRHQPGAKKGHDLVVRKRRESSQMARMNDAIGEAARDVLFP
jgi:hypothetical protein